MVFSRVDEGSDGINLPIQRLSAYKMHVYLYIIIVDDCSIAARVLIDAGNIGLKKLVLS